jgi:hypothetical protein
MKKPQEDQLVRVAKMLLSEAHPVGLTIPGRHIVSIPDAIWEAFVEVMLEEHGVGDAAFSPTPKPARHK